MNEEAVFLSRAEAEFCYMISTLTAKATMGTDLGKKTEVLILRLQAELHKPADLMVSLSADEKNTVSLAIMLYELVIRGKNKVLEERFHLAGISMSPDEVKNRSEEICRYVNETKLDISALQKKIRYRKKIPVRKLYISDLHFYHDNMNHCMDMRGFSGYEEMNAYMIRQWNDHVTRKDEIYILGDFAISRGKAANEILWQLNGKKYLIEGNHDRFLEDKAFDRSLFEWIRPYAEIMDAKRRLILSHYPVFCYKGQYRTTSDGAPTTYMLYGHVHNTHDEQLVNEFIRITRDTTVTSRYKPEGHPIPCNMINCFCMFSDYIPLTLDEWIRLDEQRRENIKQLQ